MIKDDGGPAFPTGPIQGTSPASSGATLRDYFAIKILAGMISSPPVVDRATVNRNDWSAIAYDWADAMLTVRKL